MDLFADQRRENRDCVAPLAVRMRPRSLDEFVGQQAFVGPGKLLRRMLEADRINSALFYGPPGTGKTSLAHVIAATTGSHFCQIHAAGAGVKEVREILQEARDRLETAGVPAGPVLDIAEMHRDPQTLARDMVVHTEHSRLGSVETIGLPVKFSESPGGVVHGAPLYGEHSREVLKEFGFEEGEIERLVAADVVAAADGPP